MNNSKYAPITHVFAYAKGSFDGGPLLDRQEYQPAIKESIRRDKINRSIDRRNFWGYLLAFEPLPRLDASPFAIYGEMSRA